MYRLMLVDDEVEVAKALQRLFRRHGFTVEIANTPQQALERLDAFSPEIVISDFLMPEMNGLELLTAIRQRRPQTLRFMLTGYADLSGSPDRSVEDLCTYLSKPWDEVQLLETLREKLSPAPAA